MPAGKKWNIFFREEEGYYEELGLFQILSSNWWTICKLTSTVTT